MISSVIELIKIIIILGLVPVGFVIFDCVLKVVINFPYYKSLLKQRLTIREKPNLDIVEIGIKYDKESQFIILEYDIANNKIPKIRGGKDLIYWGDYKIDDSKCKVLLYMVRK